MGVSPLRLVFAGTPDFAAAHLAGLLASPHEIAAVYTQPDRPAGRGRKLTASPVKQLAQEHNLPLEQPSTLRQDDAQATLAAYQPDVLIVVAYGLILPQNILDTPRLGCLNVHASLLPRWRGAAPIQRAIEAGDDESGITIMQMDVGLDTGDMLAADRCAINAGTTAASLHDELAALGGPLLISVLNDLGGAQSRAISQDDSAATYANKITKEEARIDWSLPASELARRVRAFNPFPVCFTEIDGQRLKIHAATAISTGRIEAECGEMRPGEILKADSCGIRVQCGDGQLSIQKLQLPGGKPLSAAQILNARSDQLQPGAVLR
ncbi:MAG: methionyl-tRNA formyltransferase [Pseudomonadota bacterium]